MSLGSSDQRSGGHLPKGPLHSPAAERNKGPILEQLVRLLPDRGLVLEIASGSGQHVAYFAAVCPRLTWQPSDTDPELVESLAARLRLAVRVNVREPLRFDVRAQPWPMTRADAVVCINMIHIAPWASAVGLFSGSAPLLAAGAPLILYGPFRRGGGHTAPSNERFDANLRWRDPEWGVRDLEDVDALATGCGFTMAETVDMPANNLLVTWRRD
jgi:SAM-dependent methyltransferase